MSAQLEKVLIEAGADAPSAPSVLRSPADPGCCATHHGKVPSRHGVTYNATGTSPIVRTRYRKITIDLCEAEFAKLSPAEKELYEKIELPDIDCTPRVLTVCTTEQPVVPSDTPGVQLSVQYFRNTNPTVWGRPH